MLAYTVRGLSADVGGRLQRGEPESTRSLCVQRAPIPSSTSYCILVLPSALYNHHSGLGGVQPAQVADNAIVGESESERSISAHVRTRLAHAPRATREVYVFDAGLPRPGSEFKTGMDSAGYMAIGPSFAARSHPLSHLTPPPQGDAVWQVALQSPSAEGSGERACSGLDGLL